MDTNNNSKKETAVATLGGGCFWCLEPVFNDLQGVLSVVVGYAGGTTPSPNYQQVCSGITGHAEVIQVTFDPTVIAYREMLEVFFSVHDPTTLNRQGADIGTQYRSIILYQDDTQKETAQDVIRQIETEGIWSKPIVTELNALQTFYQAEDYHQQYYQKNPHQGYCMAVISPKVTKFRKKYQNRLKNAA